MNQPLISIITVTYNAASVIEKTLQSAIHQTYKNIELVIIDGASTDDTVKIAQQFSPYIGTLISEKDGGIFCAMNKGIQHAKGEWIFFLNAGDYFYDTTVLEDIFTKTYDPCVELIYGKTQIINHNSGIDFIVEHALCLKNAYRGIPTPHQAIFTKKSAFDRMGKYDSNLKIAADGKWLACFLLQSTQNQIVFINKIISLYDANGTSTKNRLRGTYEYLGYSMKIFPWRIKLRIILLCYPYQIIRATAASLNLQNIPLLKEINTMRLKKKYNHKVDTPISDKRPSEIT